MSIPALQVHSLATYPVKSCAAIATDTVSLDDFGFTWDRRWMVVDGEGRFLTQREQPRLAQVTARVDAESLEFGAPGRLPFRLPLEAPRSAVLPVTVWKDTVAVWDEGDAVAAWLSDWLGCPARLRRFPEQTVRRVNPEYSPEFARTAFADAYPVLLATTASLAELNRRLIGRGAAPVTMDRFRPNLVVESNGLEPFAEDDWRRIRIGAIEFDLVKPCTRCAVTTTDQTTGLIPEPGEPLATLATFRRWQGHVIFAHNLVHRGHGPLRVGDAVTVVG